MRLRSTLIVLALLVAGGLGLPRGHAAPEDGWSLAARVPATALGYLALEDVGEWEARFQKTAIYKLCTQPDMQKFFAPIMQGLEQMAQGKGPMEKMPPPVQELLQQLQHLHGDIALAVLDVDPSTGMPSIIASLDFGEHGAQFGEFLRGFRAEVDPQGEHIQETTVDGRTQWNVNADGMPITATVFDSAFIISNSADALSAVVAGEVESSLASSASYARVRTQAGGDDLALFAYVNMPPITEMIAREAGRQAGPIIKTMGLDTIHGVGVGIAFAGDGFRDSLIVHAPNPSHGLFSLFRYAPYQAEALRWVPSTAFYYSEGKANLDEYVTKMVKFMGDIEPGAAQGLQDMLTHVNTQIGMDVDQDFVRHLDGHTCFYVALPETGGLYPEVVVMLKAKDGPTFEAAMAKLMQGIAGIVTEEGDALASTRTIEFRRHKLHLLELESARRGNVVPFTPTWARISDNWFAISLVPHTMKELVLRATSTAEEGLAQQEDFQAVMAQRPANTGSVGYLDLQALLTLLYDTGVPVLQTVVKPNMLPEGFPPLDFATLPPTRLIRPYLRSVGLFASWDDQGLSLSTHGPIPMGAVFIGAMVAAAAIPAMMMARRPMREPRVVREPPRSRRLGQVQRDVAEMQARDLARHVRTYVLKNAALPPSLQTLVDQEMMRVVPHDPWGQPFTLVVTNAEQKAFKLLSAGPDGRKGTDDDILVDG